MTLKILLLEDDSGTRGALVEALSRRRYQVAAAATVEEFQVLLSGTPDAGLALLDRNVGGKDSLLLLDEIRRLAPDLPVLVMSSDASPDSVRDVLGRGVRAFFAKPFNLGTLVTTIEEILG